MEEWGRGQEANDRAQATAEIGGQTEPPTVSSDFARQCTEFLNYLAEKPSALSELLPEDRAALLAAAGRLARPSPLERTQRRKARRLAARALATREDRRARALTGIRLARESAVFVAPARLEVAGNSEEGERLAARLRTPKGPRLDSPRRCYVCNNEFVELHFFYDALCPDCGDFNYEKRFQTAPLPGRTAIVTGARLKIGYQTVLLLLRSGARVVATTRFPVDAALRFSREHDFSAWKDRLQVCGLDLRHTPSVELFAEAFERRGERLDILINNAAQTVRRPPGFYAHLLENERRSPSELPADARSLLELHREHCALLGWLPDGLGSARESAPGRDGASGSDLAATMLRQTLSWHGRVRGIGLVASAELSQIPYTHDDTRLAADAFPEGKLDADLQQVDRRDTNSWRLRLGEIETAEMLELQLINAVAPFVLCNRLVPILRRDYTGEKHIVNVSAIEGKFFRFRKPDRHPHTNMAKAALNMLTHTSASDLARDGIFMNAVDTGWVTDEDPLHLAREREATHDFQPPLDIVDGAARVVDPLFDGVLTGRHVFGKFLKDYRPIDW